MLNFYQLIRYAEAFGILKSLSWTLTEPGYGLNTFKGSYIRNRFDLSFKFLTLYDSYNLGDTAGIYITASLN